MNSGPTTPKRNDMLCKLLPFHNCSFSTERMDYQVDYLPEITNDAWNIFRKRGMHFIDFTVNSLLYKADEVRCIAKLTNATERETKFGNTALRSELEIEGHELVKFDQSRKAGGVACFVKNVISYNRKINFCINTESIFIEMFLLKSKPLLIGVLYQPLDKNDFVNCLEGTFSDTNFIESKACSLLGDTNINLQSKGKEISQANP